MKKGIDITIKIVLLVVIVLLSARLITGIQKPIEFEELKDKRFNLTIERLKDIRTGQIAYKEKYGSFTPSLDSLINFIKSDSMRIIRAIGFVPDSLTEAQALKLGIISRDTFFVGIKDSLFKKMRYPLDSMKYIPTGTKVQFVMDTASVMTGSQVEVKVFEASATYDDVLYGLDEQEIINLKAKYRAADKNNPEKIDPKLVVPVLRVGNLKEANNNAGNWE
ncbi:MAG: hypothetical protein LBQ22_11125 [Bacteroidales bacterium]|jgi:hypothetical protein|nr:hypothetical protein [Bacteroidales bacterium]